VKPKSRPGRSLQISEDFDFQVRNWRAERIAWVVMALVLAAAALGLFSVGPLSNTSASTSDGALKIAYPRFLRLNAPATFKVHVRAASVSDKGFALELNPEFADSLQIVQTLPAPERWLTTAQGVRLQFAAAAGEAATVHFHIDPIGFGSIKPRISLVGAGGVDMPIFVYP